MTDKIDSLVMDKVSKAYPGTLAVDHVDFKAEAGEVHALMGENGAGKSTLMKILAGSFDDYTGNIYIQGKKVELHNPAQAIEHGIGMIYQELSLAGPISIAENLLAGQLPLKNKFILDKKELIKESKKYLEKVGLDLDPMRPVEEISQHEAQLVEIAKVLSHDPGILVMDEPTSALSREEVDRLFTIINQLKKAGFTIIYISHHISEIMEICDRVTVLRDGKKIDTSPVKKITPEKLVRMMIGSTPDKLHIKKTKTTGEIVLNVKNLWRKGFFHDISFNLKKGEILGIAGLSGAGRTELVRSICGLDPIDSGTVELDDRILPQSSYKNIMKAGIHYLCEDRKTEGLFLRLSVKLNLIPGVIRRKTGRFLYSSDLENDNVINIINNLDIVTDSSDKEVSSLSGGNQQKVLLGKWIMEKPRVLIVDEPTRGVDVKAKIKIHNEILKLVAEGVSVILISSDLPELAGLSDRSIVLRNGHLIGEINKKNLTEENVLLAANGHGEHLYD